MIDLKTNALWQSIVWPNHKPFESFVENTVYYIENIKTGKFPDTKPHGLNSRWGFKIVEAPEAVSKKFSQVEYIDGTTTGNILGSENIYHYDACKICLKKVFGKDVNCRECKQLLVIVPYFSFNVDIAVTIENDDEEIIQFKGFKKMIKEINIEDPKSDEELQEQFFGKNVEITYITNKNTNCKGEVTEERVCESFTITE